MEFNWLNFAAVGAALGFLATCWSRVKDFAHRILGLFVITVEVEGGLMTEMVTCWLAHHCRIWGNYDRVYDQTYEFLRPRKRFGNVIAERLWTKSMLLWRGWTPIFWSNSNEGGAKGTKMANGEAPQQVAEHRKSRLLFLRYTLDIDAIMAGAAAHWNSLNWGIEEGSIEGAKNQRFHIHRVPNYENEPGALAGSGRQFMSLWQNGSWRPVGFERDQLGWEPLEGRTSVSRLVFPPDVVELIDEVARWAKSRQWYADRGIPWRKGFLLHGIPGTGKTALARAFAQDLDMPLWTYDLAELDNANFISAWRRMRHNAPCIALIEDIDNVFHGRKNVARSREDGFFAQMMSQFEHNGDGVQGKPGTHRQRPVGALSFDCLLNMLDGVEVNEGVFTIITTNKLDKIDEALGVPRKVDGRMEFISTRPGRIDKAVELGYMTDACKRVLAERIFKDCPLGLEEIEQWIVDNPEAKETPAQWQEKCATIALAHYWHSVRHQSQEVA